MISKYRKPITEDLIFLKTPINVKVLTSYTVRNTIYLLGWIILIINSELRSISTSVVSLSVLIASFTTVLWRSVNFTPTYK